MDDDETLTAYHEAGHAVVGYALGGRIESLQLGGEADDFLPARFGDCRIAWGPVDPAADWQRQREILAMLAGPAAEMIYRGEPLHPALYGPWQDDWQRAWSTAATLHRDPAGRSRLLERLLVTLHRHMQSDVCWAAVAALADELLAHEYLEPDQVSDVLRFWLESMRS